MLKINFLTISSSSPRDAVILSPSIFLTLFLLDLWTTWAVWMCEQVSNPRSSPAHPGSSSRYSCLLLPGCSAFSNRIWSCLRNEHESYSARTRTLLWGTECKGCTTCAGTRSNLHRPLGTSRLSFPCRHWLYEQILCRLGLSDSCCCQKTFIGFDHWELGSSSKVLARRDRISSLF